ncbi:hypothetical protein L0F63_005824 [Massospora cicadina]|nr:hypothetical protein L0F63_005824 [Massospora cicadina]
MGVFSVCDSISNNGLQERFENTASLLVNEARDTFDATTASETTNSRLCDALDVIAKDLTMTLGSSLSESFSTFSATRHC